MVEQLLVGLIVLIAAAYCVWFICPADLRVALVRRLQRRCSDTPAATLLPGIARAAAVPNSACAGCGARTRCPANRSAEVIPLQRSAHSTK